MLFILFTLILLFPVWAGYGSIFNSFCKKSAIGLSGLLLSGIFSTSLLFTCIAFFLPLNIYFESSMVILGIFLFFYYQTYLKFWDFLSKQPISFYVISVITLLFGTFAPFILDHFGYYVPTIKWISEIGLVKGISNLDLVLGQMSIWHIFEAGFSNFSDPFLKVNTLIIIVYLIYIFEKKSWLHLLFLPILFLFSQSPSPDLPVIIFSLIILNELYFGNKNSKLLFAFSVFVFAIKPTMAWVPLLVFLNSIFILKHNLKFTFGGNLILLLFFIKNIWIFGYPIFPASIIDLGFSWKPNPEVMKLSSQTAIEKTFDMQFSYAEIQKFTTWEHIKNWLFLKGIKSGINISLIVSILFLIIYTFIKKNKFITFFCFSILIKTIAVLLFSAQYRFFIDVFFAIIFIILINKISRKQAIIGFSCLSLVLLGYLSVPKILQQHFPSFKLGGYMQGFTTEQLYQPATYEYHKFRNYQLGNLNFNITEAYPFSFDTDLPAISPSFIKTYTDAGIFPQKIGENIKIGFKWRKITPSEKQKLTEIYNNWLNRYPKNPDNN